MAKKEEIKEDFLEEAPSIKEVKEPNEVEYKVLNPVLPSEQDKKPSIDPECGRWDV